MTGSLTRAPGLVTGARGIISGSVSNGKTWNDSIEITEDGTALTGTPTSWTWTFTFRKSYDDSVELTLSTTDSTLAVTQGSTSTTIEIKCPRASLTDLDGDYLADLRSLNASDVTIDTDGFSEHWAHGTVTFVNEPPT